MISTFYLDSVTGLYHSLSFTVSPAKKKDKLVAPTYNVFIVIVAII